MDGKRIGPGHEGKVQLDLWTEGRMMRKSLNAIVCVCVCDGSTSIFGISPVVSTKVLEVEGIDGCHWFLEISRSIFRPGDANRVPNGIDDFLQESTSLLSSKRE